MNRTIYRVSTWTHESKTGKSRNCSCMMDIGYFDTVKTFDDLAQAEEFYNSIELRAHYQGRCCGVPIYVHECKMLESVKLDEDGEEVDNDLIIFSCPDYVEPSDDEDEDDDEEAE